MRYYGICFPYFFSNFDFLAGLHDFIKYGQGITRGRSDYILEKDPDHILDIKIQNFWNQPLMEVWGICMLSSY